MEAGTLPGLLVANLTGPAEGAGRIRAADWQGKSCRKGLVCVGPPRRPAQPDLQILPHAHTHRRTDIFPKRRNPRKPSVFIEHNRLRIANPRLQYNSIDP